MLRTVIIGMGVVGKRRARAVVAHPSLDLIGTADDEATARVLLAQRPELAVVCVPNRAAPPACLAALAAGAHVFCEKPPARSSAELRPVIEAARSLGRVLMYGFNHRHHGSVRWLLDAAASGRLGALRALRGVYVKTGNAGWRLDPEEAGGGILLDQGIHMLDLFLALAPGLRPVFARVRGMPLEDDVVAVLESPSGVVAQLHSSARAPRCRFRLEADYASARVTLDGILSGSMAYAPERLVVEPAAGSAVAPVDQSFELDDSWAAGLACLVDAVRFARSNASVPVHAHGRPEQALAALELVEAIYAAGGRRSGATT
jgi:predicted dehydrogenase